ncbi:MAG: putative NADH oxidase [Candidatus Hecatellales archaeon B24]|nr:MAG: putative NADH oxidase [Candidatus Hecatellales archaeon B24]
MPKNIVIGGGLAGFHVLEDVLKRAPEQAKNFMLITKEKLGWPSTCGIPFGLAGEYDLKRLEIRPPSYYREKGFDVKTETEVTSINVEDNTVSIGEEKIRYGNLIIATGKKPSLPPIEGIGLEGVYTLTTLTEAFKVEKAMKDAKEAVIIGAGVIGLETAAAFSSRGIKTTVIELMPSVLPLNIDSDMAAIVQKRLEDRGIRVMTSTAVNFINGKEKVESVTAGGREIPADLVVVATGIRPEVELARKAGIEIGETGGIKTDSALHVKKGKTYLSNVYALGDCVEVISGVTYRPVLSALGSTAALQSRVIVDNLLGGKSIVPFYLSPFVTSIAGLQVGSVGATFQTAKNTIGIEPIIGKSTKLTRARYYPGAKQVTVKLLFDCERLIGAQVISEETVAERINLLTIAVMKRLTAKELWLMERCFNPAVSLMTDAIVDAAMDALNKM